MRCKTDTVINKHLWLHKLGAVAAGTNTTLCKVLYKCTGTDSPCFEELTSETRCPLLFLYRELKLPSWATRCLPYGHQVSNPAVPSLHDPAFKDSYSCNDFQIALNILHSGRTCPHRVQEPCHSRGCAFVVACPKIVSGQSVVVSWPWAVAVDVDLCKTRERCSLLLHRSSQRVEDQHSLIDPPHHLLQRTVCSGPFGGDVQSRGLLLPPWAP